MGSTFLFKIDGCNFVLNRGSQSSARNIALHLFLREEGENLKEAYVYYISALKLYSPETASLSQRSWRSPDRRLWPDVSTLSSLQHSIVGTPLAKQLNVCAVKESFGILRGYISRVVSMSKMAMFWGNEYLLERVLHRADVSLDRLGVELIRYQTDDDWSEELDFTPIEELLKEVAMLIGDLLKTLCKLAEKVGI